MQDQLDAVCRQWQRGWRRIVYEQRRHRLETCQVAIIEINKPQCSQCLSVPKPILSYCIKTTRLYRYTICLKFTGKEQNTLSHNLPISDSNLSSNQSSNQQQQQQQQPLLQR